jgi:hypothetical protein
MDGSASSSRNSEITEETEATEEHWRIAVSRELSAFSGFMIVSHWRRRRPILETPNSVDSVDISADGGLHHRWVEPHSILSAHSGRSITELIPLSLAGVFLSGAGVFGYLRCA